MTVEAISEDEEEPLPNVAQPRPTPALDRAPGQRAHVKQLTLYLPHPLYRKLRELAFHEEKRMHSLLLEGLDRVLADRGAPSIKQITRTS